MTTSSEPRTTRLAALDLLRFAAATSVMLYHYIYSYAGGSLTVAEAVTMHGYLGVPVFFLVSGFVVLWSCKGRSPSEFLRARVVRLYPEFWIALLITVVAYSLAPARAPGTLTTIALNATMVPGWFDTDLVDGVYWTLAVEMKFYGLLWLVLLFRQTENVEGWLNAWLAVVLVQSLVPLGPVARPVAALTIFPTGALFAAGGLFYLVYESGWTARRILGIVLALGLSAYHTVLGMQGFVEAEHITTATRIVTALIIALAFGFFAFLPRIGVRHVAWMTLAGALTYPLYLVHNVPRAFLLGAERPRASIFVVSAALSLALAYAVLRAAERYLRPALKQALRSQTRAGGNAPGLTG